MDDKKWLEAFHKATAIPLRFYCGKDEQMYLPESYMAAFDRKPLILLNHCDQPLCYTVTMEQIAYGLIRGSRSTIIIGPVPCVKILGSLRREAVRHADLAMNCLPSVKAYLESVAVLPLPRFLSMIAFIAYAVYHMECVEPYFLDEMSEASFYSEMTEDDQQILGTDDADMLRSDFATLVMNAIYQGLPDDVAENFSHIDEYFPPSRYRIQSPEIMHDTVVYCLGRAVQTGIMAGLSPAVGESLSLQYQENLSKSTSVRSMVKLLKTILMDFASRVRSVKKLHFQDGLSQRIVQEIDLSVYQKITPSTIADHLHMNVNYLCTHFKSVTGMTINDYITQAKIETAKYFLRTTKQSITQISAQLSFSSSCYFSSVFKKSTGTTPMEYRNRHTS